MAEFAFIVHPMRGAKDMARKHRLLRLFPEAVLVALSGKRPEDLTEADYLELAERVSWKPGVTEFAGG